MKTLYRKLTRKRRLRRNRKLTRKRRLRRNLCRIAIALNKLELRDGICRALFDENIPYWQYLEVKRYIIQNKPKDVADASYWWAQDLQGRKKRIEFLMNLIIEL